MSKILALDIETEWGDPPSPHRQKITMCGLWDGQTYTCCRTPEVLQSYMWVQYYHYDLVGHRTDFDVKFLVVQGWLSLEDLEQRMIHDTRIIGSLLRNRVPKEYLKRYGEERKVRNKAFKSERKAENKIRKAQGLPLLPIKGIEHRPGTPLSLKVMAPWYLKVPWFWEMPGNHDNENYNMLDCRYTYQLYQLLSVRLQAEGYWEFYEKRMLEWSKMIRHVERQGVALNEEQLHQVEIEYDIKQTDLRKELDTVWAHAHETYRQHQEFELEQKYFQMFQARLTKMQLSKFVPEVRIQELRQQYHTMYTKAKSSVEPMINYGSDDQMLWLLRDYLDLNVKNLKDKESTDRSVLHRLASEGREDIKTFLKWREADKVLTMYTPTYRKLSHEGVIYPSFNITGTRTGRLSSSGPNLQQVPGKLYRVFRPGSGNLWAQFDLSGIEAALIALYSGDKTLYDLLDKGESIHDHNLHTFLELFGISEECEISEVAEKFPKQRKCVKNIGFAHFYGAGWKRIAQTFSQAGYLITEKQAKWALQLLKKKYKRVFEFHEEITADFEAGETLCNVLGRPVTIQADENPYMQGFNTLIQSSASDLCLEAAYRYWRAGGNPILLVHDFIMAEEPADKAHEMAEKLKGFMTGFNLPSVHGPVKLRVEGGVSNVWEK